MKIRKDDRVLSVVGWQPTGDLGPLTGYTTRSGKAVWFLKAPPKTPPTGWQRKQRNRFRLIAIMWRRLTEEQRQNWLQAADAARLNITGYNLFVWYHHKLDHAVIRTIEHQTGINLIPLYP